MYLHHQLMSSGDHLQVVCMVELLSNVLAESVTRTSRIHSPSRPVIGVRPQQIAHWALMWHLLEPFERSDVIKGFDAGRQASVKAEELIFHNCSEG